MNGRAIFATVLGAGAAALVISIACSTTPSTFPGGDLVGPVGLGVTWAQDRDLLFIANTAGDELRALNLCTSPTGGGPLPDGGPAPQTCTTAESFQFVPGPIRVFPGSILVGNRPARLAAARLLDVSGNPYGAVVVAGAEPALRLVDANNVNAAAHRSPGVTAQPPQKIPLPIPAVDVTVTDYPAHTVRAFAVTDASSTGQATLIGLDLTVSGGAPLMTPVQHCTLNLVPSRLAVAPGPDDLIAPDGPPAHVYVGDGTPNGTPGGIGDGAVEVDVPSMGAYADPIAPCNVRRLAASDPADQPRIARPLRSIAISPPFWKAGTNAPVPVKGGMFLMGATLPNDALCGPPPLVPSSDPRQTISFAPDPTCGGGRIVFVAINPGGTSNVLRAPRGEAPDILNQPPGDPPMEPLRPPVPAREVTYLLPKLNCADDQNGTLVQRPNGFCTDVSAGSPGAGLTIYPRSIQLGAVATLNDGTTALLNAGDIRFITDQYDAQQTPQVVAPTLSATPTLNPPINAGSDTLILTFPNDNAGADPNVIPNPCPGPTLGCMTVGVTPSIRWTVTWRATIPGLETVAGSLHRTSPTTIRLDLPPGRDLTPWTTSPTLALQVGDRVRLVGFALPSTGAPCAEVASAPTLLDMEIVTLTASSIEFTSVPSDPLTGRPGFDPPAACIEGLGAAVQVVTASQNGGEWLVVSGQDVRGRVKQNQQFWAQGRRFDYKPFAGEPLPATGTDIIFAPYGKRPIEANNPNFRETDGNFDGTTFVFAVTSNDSPTIMRDLSGLQGIADGLLSYRNVNVPGGLLFVSLTGTNALLQASPGNLGQQGALAVYR